MKQGEFCTPRTTCDPVGSICIWNRFIFNLKQYVMFCQMWYLFISFHSANRPPGSSALCGASAACHWTICFCGFVTWMCISVVGTFFGTMLWFMVNSETFCFSLGTHSCSKALIEDYGCDSQVIVTELFITSRGQQPQIMRLKSVYCFIIHLFWEWVWPLCLSVTL